MCRAASQSSHCHIQVGPWSGMSLYRSTPPCCPREVLGRNERTHFAREETGGPQASQPLDALGLGPLPDQHCTHEVLIEGVKVGEELAALALHVDLLKAAEEVCRVCVARHCHLTQSITRVRSCQIHATRSETRSQWLPGASTDSLRTSGTQEVAATKEIHTDPVRHRATSQGKLANAV